MTLRRAFFLRFALLATLVVVALAAAVGLGMRAMGRALLQQQMHHDAAAIVGALNRGQRPTLPLDAGFYLRRAVPGPTLFARCPSRYTVRDVKGTPVGQASFPDRVRGRDVCFHLHEAVPALGRWSRIMRIWFGGGLVLALLLGLLLSWEMARGMAGPLERLSTHLERLARGDVTLAAVPEAGPREVAAAARAGNRLALALADARDAQRTWIASAAHALKTPLATLRLALDEPRALADGATGGLARRALAQADELIDDLLASELLSRTPPAEPVDLAALTREVLDRWDGEISLRGLDLTARLPVATVSAHPQLLRHVLDGAVCNACKYTPPGGAIEVAVELAGDRVRWTCGDSGIGLPAALQERVGQPFFRAPNAQVVASGSGLGVSLAQQIAQRYGGSFTLRPRPDGGTLAELILPAAEEPQGSGSKPAYGRGGSAG